MTRTSGGGGSNHYKRKGERPNQSADWVKAPVRSGSGAQYVEINDMKAATRENMRRFGTDAFSDTKARQEARIRQQVQKADAQAAKNAAARARKK